MAAHEALGQQFDAAEALHAWKNGRTEGNYGPNPELRAYVAQHAEPIPNLWRQMKSRHSWTSQRRAEEEHHEQHNLTGWSENPLTTQRRASVMSGSSIKHLRPGAARGIRINDHIPDSTGEAEWLVLPRRYGGS